MLHELFLVEIAGAIAEDMLSSSQSKRSSNYFAVGAKLDDTNFSNLVK